MRPFPISHDSLLCSPPRSSSPLLHYGPCRACPDDQGWLSQSNFEGDNTTVATGGDSTRTSGTDPGFVTTAQNATVGLNFTGESNCLSARTTCSVHVHTCTDCSRASCSRRVLLFFGADISLRVRPCHPWNPPVPATNHLPCSLHDPSNVPLLPSSFLASHMSNTFNTTCHAHRYRSRV